MTGSILCLFYKAGGSGTKWGEWMDALHIGFTCGLLISSFRSSYRGVNRAWGPCFLTISLYYDCGSFSIDGRRQEKNNRKKGQERAWATALVRPHRTSQWINLHLLVVDSM